MWLYKDFVKNYINLENQPLNSRVLKQMIDIQAHRGPDDQGMVEKTFLVML